MRLQPSNGGPTGPCNALALRTVGRYRDGDLHSSPCPASSEAQPNAGGALVMLSRPKQGVYMESARRGTHPASFTRTRPYPRFSPRLESASSRDYQARGGDTTQRAQLSLPVPTPELVTGNHGATLYPRDTRRFLHRDVDYSR